MATDLHSSKHSCLAFHCWSLQRSIPKCCVQCFHLPRGEDDWQKDKNQWMGSSSVDETANCALTVSWQLFIQRQEETNWTGQRKGNVGICRRNPRHQGILQSWKAEPVYYNEFKKYIYIIIKKKSGTIRRRRCYSELKAHDYWLLFEFTINVSSGCFITKLFFPYLKILMSQKFFIAYNIQV